jgi:hypothetical protein
MRSRQPYIRKEELRNAKIGISDKYTFSVSVWIVETPNRQFTPTANLKFKLDGSKLPFRLSDAVELIAAIATVWHFLNGLLVSANDRQNDAIEEYLQFHKGAMLPPLKTILLMQLFKTDP